MELASGHTVQLEPECSAPAVLLRLPQALKHALAAAQRNGERIAFRCIRSGDSYQATLSVGVTQHQFSGVSVDKQTVLRLSTLEDVPGAVVADIGCKLHQHVPRALHSSNIGSRIRASAQAEKQGRGQTQVLDRAPPQNGHKAYRSVTPPAVVQRPVTMQPRPKTPPPVLERSSAPAAVAAGSSRSQPQAQTQASRLLGRSLTPPNSRPSTPPPMRQQQQSQQQAPVLQQQQQARPQPKPVAKEPPKPRSLSGKLQQQQQQRRTPPPASIQQQSQQRPATVPAASRGGTSASAAVAGEQAVGTAQPASAVQAAAAPRASPAPTAVPSAAQAAAATAAQYKNAGGLRPSAGANSTAQTDRGIVNGSTAGGSRPGSRGVSPAVGPPTAAAAAAKQQQARAALPLISAEPLPQSAKAGDRRSPAPSGTVSQQQQQQQPPQRSRLQQGTINSRPASLGAAAGRQSTAAPAAASAAIRPSSAASQQSVQQQQARKRLAPNNGGTANSGSTAGKAAKMRRLNDLVPTKAGQASTVAAVAASGNQPAVRKASTQPQMHASRQQPAQPQRRVSPSLPAVSGQRLSPDGSCSAGASPSQQQQHTKHWFTSSEESGGVCSVDGDAAGASKAAAPGVAVPSEAGPGAAGLKRKREPDIGPGAAVPPTQAVAAAVAAPSTGTHHSWAAAMQAKKQQSGQQSGKSAASTIGGGRIKPAVDPAAAKSSWQAALKQRSPPHQTPSAATPTQQPQQPGTVTAAQVAASGQSAPALKTGSSSQATSKSATAKAVAVVDFGPPGYSAFVDREPRGWGPINSHLEYVHYADQYKLLYSMYSTLSNVIEANIRTVREAHEKMAAQSLGSPAHSEAKQQLQHLLTSRTELTRRHNSALHTLHKELAALKQQMQQWLIVRRAPAAAAVSSAASGQLHALPVDAATAGRQQCVGGKGLMLAAVHGMPPAAVVGA